MVLQRNIYWLFFCPIFQTLLTPLIMTNYSDFFIFSPSDKYQVFDSAPRGLLRVEELEDQGQSLANVFILRLLENADDREVSYMLKASSQYVQSAQEQEHIACRPCVQGFCGWELFNFEEMQSRFGRRCL